MSVRGRLITVEGLDGAGKSTHLTSIAHWLSEHGRSVTQTREPGGTDLGERVRDVLLHATDVAISPRAEALAMFAARAHHIDTVIEPALSAGNWVLCDRFTEATYAYQGGGRELGHEAIAALEQWTQGDLRPDLTLYYDVDQSVAEQRLGDGVRDRFESESDRFRHRVREAYLRLVEVYPDRVKRVDASGTIDDVWNLTRTALEAFARDIDDADSVPGNDA